MAAPLLPGSLLIRLPDEASDQVEGVLGEQHLGVELLELGRAGFDYFWGWSEVKSVVTKLTG